MSELESLTEKLLPKGEGSKDDTVPENVCDMSGACLAHFAVKI